MYIVVVSGNYIIYNYTTSDFGANTFYPDQFLATIQASSIAAECLEITTGASALSDVVSIVFASMLSQADAETLTTLVAAYTPTPAPTVTAAYYDPNSNIIQHVVNSIPTKYLGDQTNEIHISKQPQGHFSTIQAAIAANPGTDIVFVVHPGTYVENNPIILAAGCVLEAEGSAENTFVVAENPSEVLLSITARTRVEGINFVGAATGLYFNGSSGLGLYSAIMECFFIGCNVGIEIDAQNIQNEGGIQDTLYAREIIIAPQNAATNMGVYVHSGGQFIAVSISCYGFPPTPPSNPAVPVNYAYYSTDPGSKIAMSLSNCYFCGNGLYLDNDTNSEIALLTARYNYNGIVIGPNGTGNTRLSVSSLESSLSSNYDFAIYPSNAIIEVHSGVMDDTLLYNPNNVSLNMHYTTSVNGQSRQHLTGVICVGTPSASSELYIGEGYYDIYQNCVLQSVDSTETNTFTNVTQYSNQTTNMNFPLWIGTAVDNSLYIGRAEVPVGIYVNIATPTTSTTPDSAIEWTYWNGSAWAAFNVMQTSTTAPYYYIEDSFVSVAQDYQVRFGLTSQSPLVAKTINGISKLWIRARIVSALSSIPVTSFIYSHTSATKYNTNGFVEFFGDARPIKNIDWDLNDLKPCGTSGNQGLYFGQSLGVQLQNNLFASGVLSSIARTAYIPTDLDGSFPIKVKFSVVGDSGTAGVAQFVARFNFSNVGTNIYFNQGDAPATDTGEMTATALVTISTANASFRGELDLNLAGINTNPSNTGPQLMWCSIQRDATGGNTNDTYPGNVAMIQITPYYISWINGCHILAF